MIHNLIFIEANLCMLQHLKLNDRLPQICLFVSFSLPIALKFSKIHICNYYLDRVSEIKVYYYINLFLFVGLTMCDSGDCEASCSTCQNYRFFLLFFFFFSFFITYSILKANHCSL